ncbi:MAG: radical SAM protein, partial [Candidatus Desulfatibia sp.]|uniref:radical SAM protein n=1 Tax=Candidatus Desulfatibia sp. TaxID=3101189 RepID=UPI002F2EB962
MHTEVKESAISPLQSTPIGRYVHFPIQRVHLELTNACNFDCTFCPKRLMTRKYGFMETPFAKRIIDQIVENRIAQKITFHIMGEPFLHRDFFEILAYCRDKGLPTGITTNGSFLSPDTAQRLAPLNVSQVNISLQ